MVQLTKHAAIELQAIRDEVGLEPSEGIKLIPDGDSVDVAVEAPGEGDEVIRQAGELLLIVDAQLVHPMRDLTVDCEEIEVEGEIEYRFLLRAA